MAQRLVVVWIAIVFSLPPAWVAAQTTLGEVVAAVTAAREAGKFATREPALDAQLAGHLDLLRSSKLLTATVETLASELTRPRLSALARLESGLVPPRVAEALTELQGLSNNELREALGAETSPAYASQVLKPVAEFHAAELDQSIANSEELLRRFERKFGPGSARLNAAEVLLNFGLQRVKGFGPSEDGTPGPLEAIASYSATYVTYSRNAGRMVSAGEFGIRRYFFGQAWSGGKGWRGLLRPAYMTVGVAVAGENDETMRWPWQGDARVGMFASWGEVKVAYVFGASQRLMFSRQFQLVPWAF